MTFRDNTRIDVWNRLPASKFLLGKDRINKIIDRAVKRWPSPVFANAETRDERKLLADAFAYRIAKDEFGSVMVILFIGLATALVQVLLEWWLLKPAYRIEFSYWRQELSS